MCVIRNILRKKERVSRMSAPLLNPGSRRHRGRGYPWSLTVGAQQALELGQQPDGVELPQEAVVVQAVPQLDDEATDESS